MAKKASSKKTTAKKTTTTAGAKSKSVTARTASIKAAVSRSQQRPTVTSRVVAKEPVAKKVKSPLTKSELTMFRQMLMEKRRAILGDMTGIEAEAFRASRQDGSGDLSNMPTHPADIGTDNFEQEFTLGLLESERQLLREINESLERIDSGIYGVCVGTGEPIGIARLKARPWAKYCIEYARLIEKGLVRPGDERLGDQDKADDEAEDEDEDDNEAEEDRPEVEEETTPDREEDFEE